MKTRKKNLFMNMVSVLSMTGFSALALMSCGKNNPANQNASISIVQGPDGQYYQIAFTGQSQIPISNNVATDSSIVSTSYNGVPSNYVAPFLVGRIPSPQESIYTCGQPTTLGLNSYQYNIYNYQQINAYGQSSPVFCNDRDPQGSFLVSRINSIPFGQTFGIMSANVNNNINPSASIYGSNSQRRMFRGLTNINSYISITLGTQGNVVCSGPNALGTNQQGQTCSLTQGNIVAMVPVSFIQEHSIQATLQSVSLALDTQTYTGTLFLNLNVGRSLPVNF